MSRHTIAIVIGLGLAAFALWWFVKIPKPYGAYTLRGVYVKPSPSLSPENVDGLPAYYPFANIIFGANPNVVGQQGDTAYLAAHPDDPTQSVIFTSDTAPDALVDEYLQFFKSSGYKPVRADNDLGMIINAAKDYHLTVFVRAGNPNGSYVRIIKTP